MCVRIYHAALAPHPSPVVASRVGGAGSDLLHRHRRRAGAASRGSGARREAEAQTSRGGARSRRSSRGGAPAHPGRAARRQTTALNQGLNTIYAPTGTAPTTISHNTIEALPQGENATVEKIVLQFPGVTQDSAAGGNFHVRNEHANVQTRINGIMLPDGVSGFGTFLDTALIGNISLITGALPPQFGLRTSGVLDIWTRSDAFNNTGNVGVYGGSRGTFTPSIEYGGTVGQTQYFITGRFFESNIGLENPTPNWNAIHDHTTQERGFGYVSTLLDPYTRFTFMAGASYGALPDPQHPRPDAELHRLRHLHASIPRCSTRTSSSRAISGSRRCNARSMAPTCSSPISRATAAFTSSPTRSAISSSMAWPRMSFAPILPTASPPTSPIASTRRTRCAAGSWCAPI